MNVISKFVDLDRITVDVTVQDVEHFLAVLQKTNVTELTFLCDQPQDLFNRLPEFCSIQELEIGAGCTRISDYRFLGRLKHLTSLEINCLIDERAVNKICKKLPLLSHQVFRGAYLENLRNRG